MKLQAVLLASQQRRLSWVLTWQTQLSFRIESLKKLPWNQGCWCIRGRGGGLKISIPSTSISQRRFQILFGLILCNHIPKHLALELIGQNPQELPLWCLSVWLCWLQGCPLGGEFSLLVSRRTYNWCTSGFTVVEPKEAKKTLWVVWRFFHGNSHHGFCFVIYFLNSDYWILFIFPTCRYRKEVSHQ